MSLQRIIVVITFGCIFYCWTISTALCQSNKPREGTWMTDGAITAIACTSSTAYLGGSFTHVIPYTGCAAPLSTATGTALGSYPKFDGEVCAAILDGQGGMYVGGAFKRVDTGVSSKLARILFGGVVDTWNPAINGKVRALAVSGTTLYVGGEFTIVSGQPRKGIAAFNMSDGKLTSWNPGSDGQVYTIAVSGSTIYLGGRFSLMGTKSRRNIAAIDAATAIATDWNPNPEPHIFDYYISALAISGSGSTGTIYAGGKFNSIGGQPREGIAALSLASGEATAWNPKPRGYTTYEGGHDPEPVDHPPTISALFLSGSKLYVGGTFTNIGGKSRFCIAALDTLSTGAATAWDPGKGWNIENMNIGKLKFNAFAVFDTNVYVGGKFDSLGGRSFKNLAAVDAATGSARNVNLRAGSAEWDKGVNTLLMIGQDLYVAGSFSNIGGLPRNHLAAIDIASGSPTSWNPDVKGYDAWVSALALSGSTVYVGGRFTSMGLASRNNLAAVDAITGKVWAWDPDVKGDTEDDTKYHAYVNTLAMSASKIIYIGGHFSRAGAEARNSMAAIDLVTGKATAWNPDIRYRNENGVFPGTVSAIGLSGQTVYAGGSFTSVGLQTRQNIVALDATTGLATNWNPMANDFVADIALSGSTVYVGGAFSNIGDERRVGLAAISSSTGKATSWNPVLSEYGRVYGLLISGSRMFVGGDFSSVNGQIRNNAAALDMATGAVSNWNPNITDSQPDINASVSCFGLGQSTLFVGGYYPSVAGLSRYNLAQFDNPLSAEPETWISYR